MKQSYTTSYADFMDAQRLHLRRSPKIAILFWLFFRIFPVIAIALSIWLWLDKPPLKNMVLGCLVFSTIGVGLWGLVMAAMRPFNMRRIYKRMKNGRSDSEPIELEITEGQLISRIPGRSEGRFLPSAILRFEEDERVALLYVTPRLFLSLPKRVLGDAQWLELRAWLALHDNLRSKNAKG